MATIDLQGADAQRLRGGYRTSLGRDASDDEVTGWMTGRYAIGGGVDDWLKQIDASDEAQRYRQSRPPSGPAPTTPPVVGTNPDSNRPQPPSPPTTTNPAPYTGFNARHDYSAFNTARQQDPGKSAKDAFAMLSNQAPPPPFHDRQAFKAWFNQYIAPGMNALGHRVVSVDDNGFTFSNHEGTFYVDYAQNLGAPSGSMLQRLQWNATAADDATRQRYAGGPTGSPPPGGGPAPGGGGGPQFPQSPQPERQTPSISTVAPSAEDLQRARTGIYNTYLQVTGRAPSDEEINNWLSGRYGHGIRGPQDYDLIVQAIMNSPEARAYRPTGTPTQGGYQGIEYWQQQGVPTIDLFDPMTGQLKPGWVRTGNGYEWRGSGRPGQQPITPIAPTTNTNTTTTGTGAGGVGTGVQLPGNQYSDDYTRMFEELAKSHIAYLQNNFNDPFRQQYIDAMQRRTRALEAAEPEFQKLLARLEARFNDLQGPGYTGAEHEVLRTSALDPVERDRAAAKKRALEQIAARGLTPDSGIAQALLRDVDAQFDAIRAGSQNELGLYELNRREDRAQRADALRSGIYDIGQERSREQLDTFGAMEALEMLGRNEEAARRREQLGIGGALMDLGPNRLQLAMQAAGLGGNYQPLAGTLMSLAGLNQQAAFMNQQQRSSWMKGVGNAMFYLSRAGR